MLYHLHMPSYILRTFTEYPKIKSHKTKIATIRYTNDCDFYFVPLKDEILNLWNGFLAIIDFIQANPDITQIIASL